jgi:hypothetical protein
LAVLAFSLTLFCSAFLLFVIQPMVAKALLPVYGGSPGVWTICVLFFQLTLWLAYGYSWLISRIKRPFLWRGLHLVLIAVSFSAIPVLMEYLSPNQNPEQAILLSLIKQLLLPLLIIASSAPLIQYAYSQTSLKQASDPYFLYIASNSGSILALLLYPWIIERYSYLGTQFIGWNVGYILYFVLLSICLFAFPKQQTTKIATNPNSAIAWKKPLYWVVLSFIPCSLMLGVTFYVSSEIAVTPLLWSIPLALYLLSFILTFHSKSWVKHVNLHRYLILAAFFPLIVILGGPIIFKGWQLILFHYLSFFTIAIYCHNLLYQNRPPTHQLTLFYFCLASGGLLAGLFNGLFAAHFFSDTYEYPLVLILMFAFINLKAKRYDWLCLIMVALFFTLSYIARSYYDYQWVSNHRLTSLILLASLFIWQPRRLYMILCLLMITLFSLTNPTHGNLTLAKKRNFFGVKSVVQSGDMHILFNHTTVHGFEVMSLNKQNGQQSYYGGLAPIIHLYHQQYGPINASIIGLGTGMMTCQFDKDDQLTLFEIDPQVLTLAKNTHYFTFLRDCAKDARIVLGDGRLKIKQLQPFNQDMILLDAFSSDAIPTHLLTLEAIQQYLSMLSKHGILLVHISNRHLNLLPVLSAIGRRLDLIVLHQQHPGDIKQYQLSSEWVLLTSNESFAQQLLSAPHWRFVASPGHVLWQDNFSSVISVLK